MVQSAGVLIFPFLGGFNLAMNVLLCDLERWPGPSNYPYSRNAKLSYLHLTFTIGMPQTATRAVPLKGGTPFSQRKATLLFRQLLNLGQLVPASQQKLFVSAVAGRLCFLSCPLKAITSGPKS